MHHYDGKRNTVFLLSGGAGRIISAIPALEKYHRLNPQDDFKVLIYGWESLYWGHPILQERTFSVEQKGIFDLIIKSHNMFQPEPYHRWSYYNQEKSMAEAFDEEINNTNDHSDLTPPKLYLHTNEVMIAKETIAMVKKEHKKDKIVVIQPYGASANINENKVFSDQTQRSMYQEDYLKLIDELPEKFGCFYFGVPQLLSEKDQKSVIPSGLDLRGWMAIINECDYFVGVDSVGQHMARAFDKPGLVIMGSTFEKNVSYPEYFDFYRNGEVRTVYSPIRIGGTDGQLADRLNDKVMKFSDSQIKEIAKKIKDKVLN